MKVLIVGGVASGAACATRLRRLDEQAEIVMFERGRYISYANCGLPYYIGGIVKHRESLLVQTPMAMKEKFQIDVRTENEVIGIDCKKKIVRVKKLQDDKEYTEDYDKLLIATGSYPVRPAIPGIRSSRIRTLWTVPDADELYELTKTSKSAAIIGGGFVGLEVMENLLAAGLSVTLVESGEQVMKPLDFEMAQLLHEHIRQKGVELILSDGVSEFEENERSVSVLLNSGKKIEAETVVLSVGAKPNSKLAKEAGLLCNERGFVVTDENMKTSDQDIYAAGDIVEVSDSVFHDRTSVPLAGPAAKQGRIVADNIAGISSAYHGAQGTSVAKVFNLTFAGTGANEKKLKQRGFVKGRDYETVIITQNSHVGFYPGHAPLTLKLLFSVDGSHIFGAQIVGEDGVDKRIDVIATTMRLGGNLHALEELEFAYAPPYSSAKDPVNMLGFAAGNMIAGLVCFSDPAFNESGTQMLDIREDAEMLAYEIPGAVHIPLAQLRSRMDELDKNKETVIFCRLGVRSYNAARILQQNGFAKVSVYPGGTILYRAMHPETG